MIVRLLARVLKPSVAIGALTLIGANKETATLHGRETGPVLTLRFHDRLTPWRIALNPATAVGEAYMDGRLTVEGGDIYDLIVMYYRSTFGQSRKSGWVARLWSRLRELNWPGRARRNVAHHYDLGNELYQLFLDEDMQYSCAYFENPRMNLEAAQRAKKEHIANKLLLAPGQRVLDIGCGWGGLALSLAERENVTVTGLTLAERQIALARARAEQRNLAHRVHFELKDYRAEEGRYDRIVSVGMFEHVGRPNYSAFFRQVHDRLTEDGVALIHTIGRMDGPGSTIGWLEKYVFPGGYSPALSEILPAIERENLFVTDIEVWRLHYGHTLRHWRERFRRNWDIAQTRYDERFCRMWDFYLAGCQASFEHDSSVVFQIQIAKRRDTVPQTRNYLYQMEDPTLELPKRMAARG